MGFVCIDLWIGLQNTHKLHLHSWFSICFSRFAQLHNGTHWLHIAQTFQTYIAHIEQSKHCTFTTLQITRICTLDRVNIYYIANRTDLHSWLSSFKMQITFVFQYQHLGTCLNAVAIMKENIVKTKTEPPS